MVPGGFSYGDLARGRRRRAGALEFLLDEVVRQRGAELTRWREEEADSTPEEWVQASGLGRRSLRLTCRETTGMRDEVFEVLERYRALSDRRISASPGAPDPGTAHVHRALRRLPLWGSRRGRAGAVTIPRRRAYPL